MEFDFELFPNDKILIKYYTSLESNPEDLRKSFRENGITAALLNATLIITLKQIQIGVNRVLASREGNLPGEKFDFEKKLLGIMTPSDNKTKSGVGLRLSTNNAHCILVILNPNQDTEAYLKTLIKGEEDHIQNIGLNCNLSEIKQFYKIEDIETKLDQDIRGSVYNSIALKGIR